MKPIESNQICMQGILLPKTPKQTNVSSLFKIFYKFIQPFIDFISRFRVSSSAQNGQVNIVTVAKKGLTLEDLCNKQERDQLLQTLQADPVKFYSTSGNSFNKSVDVKGSRSPSPENDIFALEGKQEGVEAPEWDLEELKGPDQEQTQVDTDQRLEKVVVHTPSKSDVNNVSGEASGFTSIARMVADYFQNK